MPSQAVTPTKLSPRQKWSSVLQLERKVKRRYLLVGIVVCFVLILGVAAWAGITALQGKLTKEKVLASAEITLRALDLSLKKLYTAITAVEASLSVTALEHRGRLFANQVSNLTEFNSFVSIGYIRLVEPSEREGIENYIADYANERLGTQNQTFPLYNFTSAGRQNVSSSVNVAAIVFAEPIEELRHFLGGNMFSDPVGIISSNRTLTTRQRECFGPLLLRDVPDEQYKPGISYHFPTNDTTPSFVRISISSYNLVKDMVKSMPSSMSVYLFLDGEPVGAFQGGTVDIIQSQEIDDLKDDATARVAMTLHGRNWDVVLVGHDEFDSSMWVVATLPTAFIFALMIALTVFFFLLSRVYEARAKAQVLQATQEAAVVAEAEKQLNEFLAHEVRNPLSVAISANLFAQSALDGASWSYSDLKHATENDLTLVGECLSFIHELLDNMLDLSKFANGEISLKPGPVSVLEDILVPIKAMLEKHSSSSTILIEAAKDLPMVKGDALRIKQIILNLAKNSIKFVEKGFIRIKASYSEEDGLTTLSVEDSGPGIPKDQQSTLFDKYQMSLELLTQGTGMGLALCKVLVTAMDGTISLNPDYNSGISGCPGAQFLVRIPLKVLPSPPSGGAEVVSASESTTKILQNHDTVWRALVVDDDALIRRVKRRRLNKLFDKIEVTEVSSGEAALNEGINFDMIFMDQYMPGPSVPLTGDETIRRLRQKGCRSIIVGMSANDVSEKHLSAGADAFMRKPVKSDAELREVLTELLQQPVIRTALVVDDEATNRRIFSRTLKAVCPRCQVSEASSGEMALEKVAQQDFDVVILDEIMTGSLTGSMTAQVLRRQGYSKVLISLSGGSVLNIDLFDLIWGKPMPRKAEMSADLLRVFPRISS